MLIQKQILIVEDSEINRELLRAILSDEYQVLEAENGEAALGVLRERGNHIALILLDIMMPVMDGYTFLSIIKADSNYSSIPVIVTTQSDSEADEIAALSHGATDFVTKPYNPKIIQHRVASMIRLRETAALIDHFKYDRLTGLYSREYFYQRARETLRQHPEKHYDVICSNVENFRLVNDILGIEASDRILVGIASEYRRIWGHSGLYARLNADQFVCMAERREADSDEIFLPLQAAIRKLPNARNIVLKWGVYRVTDRSVTIEQMCDRALMAARSIKGQYGKSAALYDDGLRNQLLRRQEIINCMEAALSSGQFRVYFQPKYRLLDDRLAGAEALVRWIHPELGFQSPAEFIPIFEKNGFITRLDQYVWRETCRMLRAWDDAGHPPVPVSVNVSRADVYNADIEEILTEIVRGHGLEPARLHLEITESAYVENPEQMIRTVRRLRELGFVIEIDDFGSGYSSLNVLSQLPLDILKLDMGFVRCNLGSETGRGVLRFIMDLARWMRLRVTAEGVETQAQRDQLRDMGCDYVQGYYYGKPMPADEFATLLAREANASGMPDAI